MKRSNEVPSWFVGGCIVASLFAFMYGGFDQWQQGHKNIASIIWLITPGVGAVLLCLWWFDRTLQNRDVSEHPKPTEDEQQESIHSPTHGSSRTQQLNA